MTILSTSGRSAASGSFVLLSGSGRWWWLVHDLIVDNLKAGFPELRSSSKSSINLRWFVGCWFNFRQMLLERARCVDTPCWRLSFLSYLKKCIICCGCLVHRRWTVIQSIFTRFGLRLDVWPERAFMACYFVRELMDLGSVLCWQTIHTPTWYSEHSLCVFFAIRFRIHMWVRWIVCGRVV